MALGPLEIDAIFQKHNLHHFVHHRPFLASWACSQLPILANIIFDYRCVYGTSHIYLARRHYLNKPYKEFHLKDPNWLDNVKAEIKEIYTNYPVPPNLRTKVDGLLKLYLP